MIDILTICEKVLYRLNNLDFESEGGSSSEQLIFPFKIQKKVNVDRLSEQELRFLFVEEFKKAFPDLFYSVETPTVEKYFIGKEYQKMTPSEKGQSALLDMCIFKRKDEVYSRILNVEFKHKNRSIKQIAKDILKLIHEEQDGAFIHLLNSTDRGTLVNDKATGVLNEYYKSFSEFKQYWDSDDKKIYLIIMSLAQKMIIYRTISKQDMNNLEELFAINTTNRNIIEFDIFGWEKIKTN